MESSVEVIRLFVCYIQNWSFYKSYFDNSPAISMFQNKLLWSNEFYSISLYWEYVKQAWYCDSDRGVITSLPVRFDQKQHNLKATVFIGQSLTVVQKAHDMAVK